MHTRLVGAIMCCGGYPGGKKECGCRVLTNSIVSARSGSLGRPRFFVVFLARPPYVTDLKCVHICKKVFILLYYVLILTVHDDGECFVQRKTEISGLYG